MIRRILAILAIAFLGGVFTAPAKSKPKVAKDSVDIDPVFLSLVRTVGATKKPNVEPTELDLSALDYLSSVYEDADYYEAGNCSKQKGHKVDASVYINGLPDKLLANFQTPVTGRITSPFGLRQDGERMHKGVDIALKSGQSICAAFDGKVSRVGYEKNGYGYFIILEHSDGFQSRYAHLQKPLVKPGEEISAGREIALGGQSGNSTGPHLHFEIRCGRTPLDPTPLLKKVK